jgi:TRAP transporter TAXI family solute receptor
MGGGARRAGWSVLAQRCCLVLCTAAIASIGAAALGEPATPPAKHAPAPRPTSKSANRPTTTRATTTRATTTRATTSRAATAPTRTTVAHARRSNRHGGVERTSAEDRALAGLGERLNANTVTIIAGGLGSTALAAAQDLAAVLDDGDNLRVLPMLGAGGARNIRDVRFMKGVDLAITQTSLLARARASNELGKIDDKIVYIAKLFNEEMHVLVRADSELVSLDQLGGRTVSLGEPGSGTQLIARDVLARLGIAVREANMAAPEAIDRLRAGEIDALVLIGGKPVPALASLPSGFRVLPVPFAKPLREDFLPAALSSADYPGLIEPGREIATLAVGTVLIADNWPNDSERYGKLEKFVAAFFARLAALQAPPRHPKWREVNLTASLPGWTRFAAAEAWLAAHRELAGDEREDFQRFVATRGAQAAAPADREQLFREFLQWSEAQARR